MQLFYFHVAGDVTKDMDPEAAVVIDVLRATTTIAWALNNGAEAIEVFANIEELKQKALKWPVERRLLIGERGGKRLDGFDLGNSPLGVEPTLVKGKRLFMSTTNGTRALQRVRDAGRLYTMALCNRKAIAERLFGERPNYLCILGSGWEGSYSLEDSLAAGALAAMLLEWDKDLIRIGNDEMNSAVALWEKWQLRREDCLRVATHGQRLVKLGNHDADFKCCAELDNLSVVPIQLEKGVLRAG